MKTIMDVEPHSELDTLLDSAQTEKVLILRHGKPSAVVIGLEAYDEEDLELASSPEFWELIRERRRSGRLIPLSEVEQELGLAPKP